jgi:hypothetical protein
MSDSASPEHASGHAGDDGFEDGDIVARKVLIITLLGAVLFAGTVFAFILPNAG